jgi:hypothetical protein
VILFVLLGSALAIGIPPSAGKPFTIPAEKPAEAQRRHERVAQRRNGTAIICHRGVSEHAHENTLEAYRATFELGGDGNEIDIRATADGVLVCFHDDDTFDQLLNVYGDVSDFNWSDLRQFRFRNPGRFGNQSRIPTLIEVLELHRQYGGLLHLDIKRPGLGGAVAELITRMDMWDHVAYCNTYNAGIILTDPRLQLRRYKAPGLFEDGSDVFPEAIAAALKQPGDDLIVDDPRAVSLALGRKWGKLSSEPVFPTPVVPRGGEKLPKEAELIRQLHDADDWNHIAQSIEEQMASARRIMARAKAADQLCEARAASKDAFAALEERVRKRSLHKDWRYHGLDGAIALRSLILLKAHNAEDVARFALWRDDPALEPLADPRWHNPPAWTDWRAKMVVFPALQRLPGAASQRLCRDYLALSDDEARRIGPPQFQEAARALSAISPRTQTARELLRHRLQAVRGRAVLECLRHADEAWAQAALEQDAPYALAYRVSYEPKMAEDRH